MKLIWHIIRKDIVRERVALLVWAFLFLGQAGLGWGLQRLDSPGQDAITYAQLAGMVFVFLQVAMGYVLVARLVQADSLAGTSMFWRTRPVSAGRLLAAKLLGAFVLFGLLPVLLLWPWWLCNGFGGREIGWSTVEMLGWQMLIIAPAFLIASLVDDLGRVLLWTLLLIVGLISWIVLLQATPLMRSTRPLGLSSPGWLYTKLWLSGVIFIVAALAVAVHQYLTRNRVRSIMLAGGALGVVVLAGQVFSGNWTSALGQLQDPAVPVAPVEMREGISFQMLPAEAPLASKGEKSERGAAPREVSINLRVRVRGVPTGLQFFADNARQTWIWSDGVQISRRGDFWTHYYDMNIPELRKRFGLPAPVQDPETDEWFRQKRAEIEARQRARGYRQPQSVPFPAEEGTLRMRGYVSWPKSFVAKMWRDAPRYTAEFEGMLYRHDLLAELPVAAGAETTFSGGRVRVASISNGTPLLVSSRPAVMRWGLWYAAEALSSERYGRIPRPIVVMNEVTGDIGWVDDRGLKTVQLAGVILNWNTANIGLRTVIRNGKDVGISSIDPQWLAHTKFAFMIGTRVARFPAKIEAERFTLVSPEEQEPGKAAEAAQ